MELRQKRAHAKQRAISRIFDQIQLTSLMNSSCRFYHDAPLHRSTRSSVVLLLTVTMLVPFIGPVSAFDMMTRSRRLVWARARVSFRPIKESQVSSVVVSMQVKMLSWITLSRQKGLEH